MKNLFVAPLMLLLSTVTFAQKDLPEFGKIDKDDLLMKECDIDKDAVAYKLIDYGDVSYQSGRDLFQIVTEHRVRIKILKDKGVDYANVKLKFYTVDRYEDISNVSGITYNLDNTGNIVTSKLDKSAIFKKPIDKEYSEVAFTLPDVKAGSVIEYKFKEIRQSYSHLDDWNFQDEIPTRLSRYTILVPTIFRFVSQELVYQQVDKKKEDGPQQSLMFNDGSVYRYGTYAETYTLKNVPALPDEPLMSSSRDYAQRVVFQLSQIDYGDGRVDDVRNTWPRLAQSLLEYEDFGLQLKKNIPHTGSLDDSVKLIKDDYHKMIFIYNYVQRNMNWNDEYGIFSDNGIKSAWDKKSGNTCDINFILIDLLRDAGITAYPILVSTRDNGAVNTLYPFLQQFNEVMALAIIDGKNYAMNAADKYNPAWLVPYDVLNNEAYIIDKQDGKWIILNDANAVYQNTVSIFSQITPDGMLEGTATVYSEGYCKNPRLEMWTEDKKAFTDKYFSKSFTGVKIENLEVKNTGVDTLPLQQAVQFSLPLSASGDYEYFPINLFQGLEKNPFIDDKRLTDIDFGYKQVYQIVGAVQLPDGFEFDELPKNIRMIMPDTSIELLRLMQADSTSMQFRMTLNFEKPLYEATDYPYFKEFYKKLFDALNEKVVIKKKKATP